MNAPAERPDREAPEPADEQAADGVWRPAPAPLPSQGEAVAADGGVPAEVQATLAAWHGEGAHRTDPWRFALIEAMARRAARHQGAARAVLDARLSALVSDYRALLSARGISPVGEGASSSTTAARGALGQLVDELTGHTLGSARPTPAAPKSAVSATRARPASGAGGRSGANGGAKAEVPTLAEIDLDTVALHTVATASVVAMELQSVRRFRGTWSRLSAEERLRQTLAQVPPQAGPLNALHLLHRALVQMQDISPDYLQHFVAHVDALLWLEQVHSAAVAPSTARSGSTARAIAAKRKPAARGR